MWKLATLGTFAMLIGCSGAGIDPAFTHPAADSGVPEGTQTAPDAGSSVTSDAPSPPAPGDDAGEVVVADASSADAGTDAAPGVDAAPSADDAATTADAGLSAPDADTYAPPAECIATPYNSGEMPSACAAGTTWGCATKESDGGPANYGGYCGQYSSGVFTLVYADGGLLSVGNGGTGVLVCCPAGVPGPT
jgi:hypothetical protein